MPETSKATQEFVPIKEVRDGIIALKDGGLRAILMCSSLNFALKSNDEQTATLLQFQQFLNSLDFPVQILVQSRKLDIRPYLALLDERLKEQTSDLMRIQITEYITFVKSFVESTNIMTKNFFVVVPYSPAVFDMERGTLTAILQKKERDPSAAHRTFEENRTQLEQRVSVVEQGLIRSGIRVASLGTEEIIELFYKMFNPGELEKPIRLEQHGAV